MTTKKEIYVFFNRTCMKMFQSQVESYQRLKNGT